MKKTLGAGLLTAALLAGPVDASADTGPREYTGAIDGAEFLVKVPRRWNGTLMLFSHPYYTPEVPEGIGLANRPETETWLLEHGYALAASDFTGRNGAVYEQGQRDQLALLDWIDAHIGRPKRTIATGSSMGATLSLLLAERNPDSFAGVLAMCGPLDLAGSWNLSLDVTFAIKTLLGADADLVRPTDPFASAQALQAAVDQAMTTPEGQAKLALANAFGNVPDWNSALDPTPTDLAGRIRAQAEIDPMHIWVFGPIGRVDLEARAEGNPSWNTGIDYRRQLAKSSQRDLVRQAYRAAGRDLDADLDALASAPRIGADPDARAWLDRFGVPRGTAPTPVVTLHATADAAVADHVRWYADRVDDGSQLRQLYVNRGTHCAFTAAEEILALKALLAKIDTGRWPDTSARHLNAAAARFDQPYQVVFNYPTNSHEPTTPEFTRFSPPVPLRPSR